MEAEVEVAAFQEILAVMEEQEREAAELQKLEHENLERQQAMEKQCREIERLEEVKKLNATRAKAKVYEEGERTGMFSNKSPLKLLNKQFVGTHRSSAGEAGAAAGERTVDNFDLIDSTT